MTNTSELQNLRDEISITLRAGHGRERFTSLLQTWTALMQYLEADVARLFSASASNVHRWMSGAVVPPGHELILRMMKERLDDKIAGNI